jgi:hypothetical protein
VGLVGLVGAVRPRDGRDGRGRCETDCQGVKLKSVIEDLMGQTGRSELPPAARRGVEALQKQRLPAVQRSRDPAWAWGCRRRRVQ